VIFFVKGLMIIGGDVMKGLIELEDEYGDPCVLLLDKIYGIGINQSGETRVMLSPEDKLHCKTPYKVALKRLKDAL
jgi:hypothetical protein